MKSTGTNSLSAPASSIHRYSLFLLAVAGLGGLLYGIDVGVITEALPYVSKTIDLTVGQTSLIVAAVLGGSMISSLFAGIFADLFGRKMLMLISGAMFIASVGVIVSSHGFTLLFLGRLLQGMSGGVIAVVVPLYLAECLNADRRGRGTAIFQFMLTFGIVCASVAGWFYTQRAEAAISAAAGNADLIRSIQDHAWRSMFLCVVYPGVLFLLGSFALSESPRWLLLRGRVDEALAALRRSRTEQEAERELAEMTAVAKQAGRASSEGASGSLWQRRYIVPFVIACVVMVCNQTTGINSILGYLVVILKQAGMSAGHATQGDLVVKLLNCALTCVAVVLVERKGRRFLLRIGTSGIIVALLLIGIMFRTIEVKSADVKSRLETAVAGNRIDLPLSALPINSSVQTGRPNMLTVLYSYGDGDRLQAVLSSDPNPVLTLAPEPGHPNSALRIKRALYGPVPDEGIGWFVTACLALFIASYAFGPGVVVWLAASEVLPTRIRSVGLGISLVLNQGASTLIAAAFLPVVGRMGYSSMFFLWAACTCLYLTTAIFVLPETKGKTLEEIELYFEHGGK